MYLNPQHVFKHVYDNGSIQLVTDCGFEYGSWYADKLVDILIGFGVQLPRFICDSFSFGRWYSLEYRLIYFTTTSLTCFF